MMEDLLRFRQRFAAPALLVFSLVIAMPLAARGAVVSVPSSTSIGQGQTVQIPVSVDVGDGILGADIGLTYDPTALAVAGDAAVSAFSSGCMSVTNSSVAGTVEVGLACSTALSGGGVLFTVPFTGQASGTSGVGFSRCDLNEDAIACTPVGGTVIVPTPTMTATSSPTRTPTPTVTRTATPLPVVHLNAIPSPIVIGGSLTLTGSGFTAGSRIVLFVATATGAQAFGPYQPASWMPTSLLWNVSSTIPLGNGFGTVVVVNTDQGFIQSEPQSQYLYGAANANIPTITSVNGVALDALNPGVPVASVDTVIVQGAAVNIAGSGFNLPLVMLFSPTAAFGPLTPNQGATSTLLQITVPANVPTGPGSLQVINNPYAGNVVSNAVSVPIGAALSIASVSQTGSTITVTGTGFASVSVINFFNQQPGGTVNLGGYNASGQPNIPLTIVSSTQLTFSVPAGAVSGPSYVQVINPPYIPFSSTGGDPDGAFTLQ